MVQIDVYTNINIYNNVYKYLKKKKKKSDLGRQIFSRNYSKDEQILKINNALPMPLLESRVLTGWLKEMVLT